MTITDFQAIPDLVGRRVQVLWTVLFEVGETLADEPSVVLRRKAKDFQFPPPSSGTDPYVVYDNTVFPPATGTVRELPSRETYDAAGRRTLEVIVTVSEPGPTREVEVIRRTERTVYAPTGEVLRRHVEILDVGGAPEGLVPGTTLYYELTSPDVAPGPGEPPWQATATPGEGYGMGMQLFRMLPGIHQRHDTVRRPDTLGTEAIPEAAPTGGQLRRFLEVFGTGADAFRSSAENLHGLHDIDHVDYHYLSLLAQWIGWELSFDAPIPNRRHEIKFAPALYQLTGTVPSAPIWVQFTTGWSCRVKEYVHNVFRSNDTPRHNVWLRVQDSSGTWTSPDHPLRLDVAHGGRPVPALAPDGTLWLAYHTQRMKRWGIWITRHTDSEGWADSEPISEGPGTDQTPAMAVRADGTLWVVWARHDQGRWRLVARVREASGTWNDAFDLGPQWGDAPGSAPERKDPALTVDASGNLWLFWRECERGRWLLYYSRRSAGAWAPPIRFPDDGGEDPRVEGPPSVVAPASGVNVLWVAWPREVPAGTAGQTRQVAVVRAKTTANPDDSGWGPVEPLSTMPPAYHDTDPALYMTPGGAVALAIASDRADRYATYLRVYDSSTNTWAPAEAVPAAPAGQRFPQPIARNTATWLFYRSPRPPVYQSEKPGGLRSADMRYHGSVVTHVRRTALLAERGQFDDALAYTSDLGTDGIRTDADRVAADTVGLFLNPMVSDASSVLRGVGQIRQVARHFVPAVRRAVYAVPESVAPIDFVYGYDAPSSADVEELGEEHADTLTTTATEGAPAPSGSEHVSIADSSEESPPVPTDTFSDTVS